MTYCSKGRSAAVVGLSSKPILFLGELTTRRHAATQRLRFPAEKCAEVVSAVSSSWKSYQRLQKPSDRRLRYWPCGLTRPNGGAGKSVHDARCRRKYAQHFPESVLLSICIISLLLENSYTVQSGLGRPAPPLAAVILMSGSF